MERAKSEPRVEPTKRSPVRNRCPPALSYALVARPGQTFSREIKKRFLSLESKPREGKLGRNSASAKTWFIVFGGKPIKKERYMASNDPDFDRKTADIIGLYLDPPRHAAVFCVDEKTAIQALDRRDRVLPLSPGRAERHGFEYKRNGTLSLYAALNTKTGQVHGKTAARHTSQDFVDSVQVVTASQEIHIILDNLSAHKTKQVRRSSSSTPTYTSRRLTRRG